MSVQQLPRFVMRGSLLLAPLAHLASALVVASLATGTAAEVAAITRHPDRYYAFTLLQLITVALFVPMLVGLMELARSQAPTLAILGAGLMQLGTLVGLADSGSQLVYWQTGSRGLDPSQMAALLHHYESATGARIIFMIGGISLITGSLLLAAGLRRARITPAWSALCLPVGMIGTVVAFGAGSRPLLIGASVVLLAGLARVAANRGVVNMTTAVPAPRIVSVASTDD